MIRFRHTDEWAGLLVVLAALLFVGAMLEAGVLRDWFRPVSHLRIVLPQSGVGGLAIGPISRCWGFTPAQYAGLC